MAIASPDLPPIPEFPRSPVSSSNSVGLSSPAVVHTRQKRLSSAGSFIGVPEFPVFYRIGVNLLIRPNSIFDMQLSHVVIAVTPSQVTTLLSLIDYIVLVVDQMLPTSTSTSTSTASASGMLKTTLTNDPGQFEEESNEETAVTWSEWAWNLMGVKDDGDDEGVTSESVGSPSEPTRSSEDAPTKPSAKKMTFVMSMPIAHLRFLPEYTDTVLNGDNFVLCFGLRDIGFEFTKSNGTKVISLEVNRLAAACVSAVSKGENTWWWPTHKELFTASSRIYFQHCLDPNVGIVLGRPTGNPLQPFLRFAWRKQIGTLGVSTMDLGMLDGQLCDHTIARILSVFQTIDAGVTRMGINQDSAALEPEIIWASAQDGDTHHASGVMTSAESGPPKKFELRCVAARVFIPLSSSQANPAAIAVCSSSATLQVQYVRYYFYFY
jgi:hypothetical protein